MSNSRYNKSERKFENDPTPGFNVPLTAAANRFLGGPSSGSAATPSFRAIVPDDLPGAASGARGIIKLAGQLGGTADLPDVRGLRETGGPTLLTIGSVPDGYILKRSGSSVVGVSVGSVIGIREPLGHDITQLPSVVSHWPILDTVLGGTSVPDVNGAHDSTSATTIVASGRPWHGSEGQVWLARKATLAGSAALLTELRDASCYFMFWAMVGKADSASSSCVFFTFTAAAETSATNTQLQVQISQSYDLIVFWERSSGSNISATIGKVAPGLRHICVARQHGATSTVHAWIDGLYCGATSSLLNPDGGGSSSGFFMVDNTGTMGDTQTGCALGDCVLGSGGIPTTAQVLAQYQRGMGVY